ncbi:MAG: alpha/beta fold hydrolase [Alphaproteobacteria bacterium]
MSLRNVSGIDLWVEEGGSGGPTLLLMHGLSGTGRIWDGLRPLLDRNWPGRWIIPDMRGHGRSAHCDRYGIACHAADMADLVGDAEDLYLAGHSMGGLVGILLASGWFGVAPKAVVTSGVKVDWTDEERTGLAKLVDMPVKWFDSEDDARERFILVTGLKGVADPASDFARSGIVEEEGKWRLAADNRAALVADADTRDIYAAARAPVVLAAGEHDRMVSADDLRTLSADAVELPGLGHNAHVEDPAAFWSLIAQASGEQK